MIVAGTFDGNGITHREFNELQTILRTAKTLNRYADLYISSFLAYRYHDYLFLKTQKGSKIRTVPYTKDHIPKTVPNDRRPGRAMVPRYLTIHSTANTRSTAKNGRDWLTNSEKNRTASYHIVVDQKEAIECIPPNEIAWHAGDGKGGTGNTESIALEICESGNRTKTLKNAISLTVRILRDRKWDVSKLRRHHSKSKLGIDSKRRLVNHYAHKLSPLYSFHTIISFLAPHDELDSIRFDSIRFDSIRFDSVKPRRDEEMKKNDIKTVLLLFGLSWLLCAQALSDNPDESARALLMTRADSILQALESADFVALSEHVHDASGLGLSPYSRNLSELFITKFQSNYSGTRYCA